MTAREAEEYRALRATIRQRGTARICLFLAGLIAWAGLALGTAALTSTPTATCLPLLILAATFEAVFALHAGVERVGRYLQVFYESEAEAGWERIVIAFGRPAGAATPDPLFVVLFLLAALFNVAPVAIVQPTPVELVFVGGAHALFVVRLVLARATAARQRAIDLERFQRIKRG
ncbi:MAG: hypothetical protein HY047_19340, partial [Acidobacteria bacterium]|nr:hypothetical protein [Acidobacteriota bacterium]